MAFLMFMIRISSAMPLVPILFHRYFVNIKKNICAIMHFTIEFYQDYWARYSFIRQPKMMEWALMKLSEVLEPLVDKQALKRVLQDFDTVFHSSVQAIMHKKVVLFAELYLVETPL